jgi:ribosomal protein S20
MREKITKVLSSVYSLIDKGTKKNVFHKKRCIKKKSKLAALKSA